MKKMLLITLLFFSFKSIAQDPILLETTWYLSDITINNETLSPPIEGGTPQNFILNITETDFTANFCKTASTNIVSFPEFAISVDTYIISGDACAYEPKNEFEAIYFNDFLRINEPTNLYTYDIIIIDAPSPLNNDASVFDTILILTNETGESAVYVNTPLLSTLTFLKPKIALSPNPALNVVKVLNAQEVERVVFYDTLGRKLASFTQDFETLEISNLPKGILLVEIGTLQGQTEIFKLLKI